jgi:DNA-binding PadR family transcriptional regulator
MEAKQAVKITVTKRQQALATVLRKLESKVLIVSSLDPDGEVRWRITAKGEKWREEQQ